MSTTSTVPAVIDGFIAAVNTKLTAAGLTTVRIYESWPGPEAASEMVVLGNINWTESEFPVLSNDTRVHRDEVYSIEFSVWVAGGTGTPSNVKPARDRAFLIMESLENVLSTDPTAGTNFATVAWVKHNAETAGPREFERGWAFFIAGNVSVKARLR